MKNNVSASEEEHGAWREGVNHHNTTYKSAKVQCGPLHDHPTRAYLSNVLPHVHVKFLHLLAAEFVAHSQGMDLRPASGASCRANEKGQRVYDVNCSGITDYHTHLGYSFLLMTMLYSTLGTVPLGW